MGRNNFKKKITNHIFNSGKKQISEKILKTNFKSIQKFQKKSHNEIIKITMLNYTPVFRVIELKKKSKIEIPTFISSTKHRTSWGIKYLLSILTSETKNPFYQELQKRILLDVTSKNETLKFKDELQKKALKKKNYFKYYRW